MECPNSLSLTVKSEHSARVRHLLDRYTEVRRAGTLLSVAYTTLDEYLFMLLGAAQVLQTCKARAMFYLAAAVSDFYIPASEMVGQSINQYFLFSYLFYFYFLYLNCIIIYILLLHIILTYFFYLVLICFNFFTHDS